jgi:retron-type reverse transcriptase
VRAHRSFNRIWKGRDSAQPELLERILDKDNLNRAYKRVKANKGAPGMDGMTIEAALPYLRENQNELVGKICRGEIYPEPGQAGGDPETGRRNAEAWHSHRHRPHHPAGNGTAADADL